MKSNLISGLIIIVVIIYIVYKIIDYRSIERKIINTGNYTIAYIQKEFIGTMTVRSFTFDYEVNKTGYVKKYDVSNLDYFSNHQIGDTIIIKFLPEDPAKSIIIEDVEYKSCMGLPPKKGWKELPKCREDFF